MEQSVFARKATQEDVYPILRLANQLSEAICVSESYLQNNLTQFIENEKHCLLVAVQNETIVGYVSGYFHDAIYASGLVAYVDEIVVDASVRTMKIGSMLMTCFEDISKENGCVLVSLATFGAKGFYETLGYESKAGYFKKWLH
ncbi:GNAT family N-acetyltransferase [Dyadobacter sp. LHD-138]|uniref:GNAT family N-acetyltransferase n=1 Tax=Dyadobacter sp. LHD-138 TaxID=3071413 RepID=UPI0027E0EF25|nr:GNAT family N-acetyltransferase [Dyadobacter sp. LHD-138]MDQ6479344.1 GNAT family N-acetyltransferase [Dyadobacter sp. LHD-138]